MNGSVTLRFLLLLALLPSTRPAEAGPSNELPLTHCRINEPFVWRISQISAKDITTGSARNFEIVDASAVRHSDRIDIAPLDRFTIDEHLVMRHLRGDASDSDTGLVATSQLQIDEATHLWARGPAYRTGDLHPVGEYVVFRIEDSDGSPRSCRHSRRNDPLARCIAVRIEYFDHADLTTQSHKPALASGNVEPLTAPGCRSGAKQTSEGDGDEGPI